jgi:hypothetical protein
MQTATAARGRNELVVVEKLGLVDVGLLREKEREKVEVGCKASTGGSGTVLRAVSCERRRVVWRGHGWSRADSGSGCRGRGRVDPRTRGIRMLGFGRGSAGVHEASEPRLARGGWKWRLLAVLLRKGYVEGRATVRMGKRAKRKRRVER